MDQLHYLQIKILRNLLFSPKLKYSELRPDNIENNLLTFHLNQLKDLGLITKTEEYYFLTSKGKEYANRMDTSVLNIQKQAKISAWICCTRVENGELEFLVYTRLKHPFYGCQGFPSGKVVYGEFVLDAAIRELKEECGLTGQAKLVRIHHYIVKDFKTKELVEDKFMYLCLIENPRGDLKQSEEGRYAWIKERDLKTYVTNHFESWEVFEREVSYIKNFKGELLFVEEEHFSEKF